MNNINLINTPPPEKLKAVSRWYFTTFLSLVLMGVFLSAINCYQYYQLTEQSLLKKQLQEVSQATNLTSQKISELAAHEAKLNAQHTKMNAPKPFKPTNYLRAFANSIPDDTCLFVVDMHKKGTIQLIGYTESADSLRIFMEKLATLHVADKLELSSLQPENNNLSQLFKFTLLGQLQTV